MKKGTVEGWPYECEVCNGWCRPAADVLATADPLKRGGLVAEAFIHSLGKRGEQVEEGGDAA